MNRTRLDSVQITPALPGALPPDLALKIEYREIATLKAVGRKARTHSAEQIEAIAKSFRQFGFISAILVDENDRIITGHARIAAARSLGMTSIPAIVISHLSDAEKRAFVIADNRLGELAGWDNHILSLEFQDMTALNLDFELDVTGFSTLEIEALQFQTDNAVDDEGDHCAPSPSALTVAVSQPGDMWELGPHRILCGDATVPGNFSKLLGDDEAKVAFADPPFNVPIAGNVSSNPLHREFAMASGEMSDAEFQAFLQKSLAATGNSVVGGGLIYVCMDWRGLFNLQAAAQSVGLEQLNLIVWDKMMGGMGSFYRSQHELILLFRKAGATHQNNVELGKHGRNRTNVWAYKGFNSFRSDCRQDLVNHPTPKPVVMVRDALLDCTSKGDIVLDPFSGGGATLIAAHRSGRRGRVMEIDPLYVDLAVRRWEAETGLKARHSESGLSFEDVAHERTSIADPKALNTITSSHKETAQ